MEIQTKTQRLPTADYLLAEEPSDNLYTVGPTTIIERKHTLSEIQTNVTTRRARFRNILESMATLNRRAILLMEAPMEVWFHSDPSDHIQNPGPVFDSLMRMTYDCGVHLIPVHAKTLKQRRIAGELLTRLLINGAIAKWPEHPPSRTS